MLPRDFAILMLVCAAWAMNAIATKVVVGGAGIPPLLFAAGRFLMVLAVVFPWLRPLPRPLGRVVLVGALMGAGMFGLGFIALKTASPSAVGVVSQLGVPMITLLSVAALGERLDGRRGLGTFLSIVGCLVVMWDPHGLPLQSGLLFTVAAALCGAVGTILMKRISSVTPLQFQAWVALASAPLMLGGSLLFEHGQAAALRVGWPYFVGGVLFNGLVVSLLAHTTYYWLIRRYDTSLLAPLTLVTPLMTIFLGVWLTHDSFGPRMALGAAITLLGVIIIGVRPSQWAALLAAVGSRRP